jgi:hypothetical protein
MTIAEEILLRPSEDEEDYGAGWNDAMGVAAQIAAAGESSLRAELTTARMCGMNAANIALRLKGMGFDANVGVDEDGEWVITIYRDGKPVGCGSSLWDEERREYYWSCYIKFDGREFENGHMKVGEVPDGLAGAISAPTA